MSVKLSLNRQALASLIADDPELQLELSNAVVSEVIRKFCTKEATKIVEAADPELFKQTMAAVLEDATIQARITADMEKRLIATKGTIWNIGKLSNEANELFKAGVEDAIAGIRTTLYSRALIQAELAAENIIETLDDRVEKRVNRKFEEGLEKIVDARVKAKLTAISSGIVA